MLSATLFVVAFVTGCILAIVRHPIFGLVTYVATFYVSPPSRWWGQGLLFDVRWSLIAASATLFALMIHRSVFKEPALSRSGAFWAMLLFVAWIAIQSGWALDGESHAYLLEIYIKFALVILMVSKCIQSEEHLRWFLWAHVSGCFYLGWLAFTSYSGGRLDGVGGPGINEANAAALQIVTGVATAASLLLAGSRRARALLVGMVPFMVNGIVSTISRSGFLAAALAGVVFNLFTPARYRWPIRLISILGLLLFAMLTNEMYWDRIATIKYKGQEIEGVETGGGRLTIIDAQWRMFEGRPMGCGHMCTTVLSASYLDAKYLKDGESRASHNTFMSMLVDHGIPGGVFYVGHVLWAFFALRVVASRLKNRTGFLPAVFPGVAASLVAIVVGDQFVQYVRFEARFWFIALVLVLLHLTANASSGRSVGSDHAQRAT